jgi:two-component system CheB/CheR fusion protein
MPKSSENFWVIGVGSSAGGLEALSLFFKALPPDINAAFIVAQHLAPHSKSMMVELISRQSSLPVVAVEDHVQLKPGVISIVPPNYDVTTLNGELRLTKAGKETRPKPSVDTFFQSLARLYGSRAVGIILSGTGSDGSEGIRYIKENGGITIVQDSESAKYDGMPKSAYETGLVDAVLPPEEIAKKLASILSSRSAPQETDPSDVDPKEFAAILQYLKKEVGTDFTQYKVSTIRRRLEKRLAALGIDSLEEYFEHLRTHTEELSQLSQGMLVSVTSFFRDPEAFQKLAECLEVIISKKPADEELRIWIAGCATGEEAYTFAFLVTDICEKFGKHIPVKIFATDLDAEALAIARQGSYSEEDIKGLPGIYLERFFEKKEKSFDVRKQIKDLIVFARQDLIQNPPFVKLDLVSCRNVLIYFETSLQNRVFDIFHYALRANGTLFLGKSESPNLNLFEVIDRKEKIYRRLNVISQLTHHPSTKYSINSGTIIPSMKRKIAQMAPLGEIAPIQIMKMVGVSGLVVDDDGLILHIVGDISEYVSIPMGNADFRLSNLLPKSASIEFSVLLKKVAKEKKMLKSRSYRFERQPKKSFFILVKPLETAEPTDKPLFLVTFESKRAATVAETAKFTEGTDVPQRILELEQEVAVNRENLQTMIEELEISNEELQSLNEELSSTNEELQASNEELETTNEELQSTNEELITLNEELNVKSSELRLAYSSLENIQNSINAPLLIVDNELNLLRYNSHANQIFSLTTSDIGRPVTMASCQYEIPDFEGKLQETIRTLKSTEVLCHAGPRVYQMRVHPSLDENRRPVGLIVLFIDNTDFINTQEKLKTSDRRIRAIIDSSPTLISLKDNVGKYLMANQSFINHFKLREEEILGKTDREIFSESFANTIRDNDLEVLLRRKSSEKQEELEFDGKSMVFLSNRFPLIATGETNPYAVGTVSLDITSQVDSQKQLQESENRYRAIIQDQAVFVCRQDASEALTFSNTAFESYFGQRRNFISLVDERDHDRVLAEIKKINSTHPIVQYEHRQNKASNRWIRWIHRGIFGANHEILEYQAVGFDVTEIHNQTAELLAKENLFTHVIEHTSDYLSIYRKEGEEFYLESYNQRLERNRTSTHPRFIGKALRELVDQKTVSEVYEKFNRALTDFSTVTFDETMDGPGGTVYLSTTIVPIQSKEDQSIRVVALSRDISQLKRIERDLRKEKKNAEAANEAKSDFLAGVSHELRTPLNVIMGMSQILSRGEMKPDHLRLVESIQRSSKVLHALIEDVLDLAKIEAGKINFEARPMSISQIIQDVTQSFESQAQQKGVALERRLNFEDQDNFLGDQVRLKQILINLVGNALKFTQKGSVTIEGQVETIQGSMATLFFKVKDTGIGIPEESFSKIFQRFSQADSGTTRKFGGTGLGLSICKQLVELMHGTIGFESVVGEGSEFWFKIQLPLSAGPVTEKKSDVSLDLKSYKILAVDDVAESLKVLELNFEEKGAKLITATSGKRALELTAEQKFDLILMDMQMPELDGMETTKLIRKSSGPNKKTPIIALTANAMPEDKKRCFDAGMDDYLTKPVDFERLQQSIKKWVKA